jgi:hypothetical protein
MSEYVATTFHSWGHGFDSYSAIENTLNNERPDHDDEVKLVLWEVEGFKDVYPFDVEAEEVISREEFIIPGYEWNELSELYGQAGRQLETVLLENREE